MIVGEQKSLAEIKAIVSPYSKLLILGCGICLIVRILVPSPPSSGSRQAIFLDRLFSVIAAVALIGLAVTDAALDCVLLGRFAVGA